MCSSIEVRRHLSEQPWTYDLLNQRQRKIAEDIRAGGRGVLLLSELAPVITVGRRTPETDLLLDSAALKKLGVDRIETDRGGLATYHGPGQWVLFPVERLETLTGDPRGVKRAVELLLSVAQSTAESFGISTEIREGAELGVWSKKGKLAAVGVHVEDGILQHGLSFNVYRTPQSFVGLKPCGLDLAVDYLSTTATMATTPDESLFEQVKETLIETALRTLWRVSRSF